MAETTKTDLICDTLGVVPLRRQTSNMLWHANVSWTFSRNVWGNQHFFFFFAILYTHNKHSQDSRPDLLHSNKSYTIERPGGRVGRWGYPHITSTHSLHSLQQPSSGVVFFSCLEVCESTHQHSCLSKLLSPHHCSVTPVRGEAGGAHSHTNTYGGFSGGGWGWVVALLTWCERLNQIQDPSQTIQVEPPGMCFPESAGFIWTSRGTDGEAKNSVGKIMTINLLQCSS